MICLSELSMDKTRLPEARLEMVCVPMCRLGVGNADTGLFCFTDQCETDNASDEMWKGWQKD